jgi:hypothetical protein
MQTFTDYRSMKIGCRGETFIIAGRIFVVAAWKSVLAARLFTWAA